MKWMSGWGKNKNRFKDRTRYKGKVRSRDVVGVMV